MAFGMFVFGMGVSPLAVVQETIIVRFFKSHGLGVSLALGLVAGKGASFISALTSYPLSQHFGPHAPFYAATFLSAFSFTINLIYLSASKWLVRESGTELEASEIHAEAHARAASTPGISSEAEALEVVAKKRMVRLRDITKLGDVFWAYVSSRTSLKLSCNSHAAQLHRSECPLWCHMVAFHSSCSVRVGVDATSSFHLRFSSHRNILQRRFDLTEADASLKGSYVLGGSVILYPIVRTSVPLGDLSLIQSPDRLCH